jgi:hypothetical protein
MKEALAGKSFDAVFDVSGYTPEQVQGALDGLGERVGHYIFTSSTAVYFGSLIYPIREHDRLMPDERGGAYGWNKIKAERLLANWSQNTGIPFSVIRPAMYMGQGPITSTASPILLSFGRNRPLLLRRSIPLSRHVKDIARCSRTASAIRALTGRPTTGLAPISPAFAAGLWRWPKRLVLSQPSSACPTT